MTLSELPHLREVKSSDEADCFVSAALTISGSTLQRRAAAKYPSPS